VHATEARQEGALSARLLTTLPAGTLLWGILLWVTVLLPGCTAFPGHPVRLSQPRVADADRASAGDIPEPSTPEGDEARDQLFLGLRGILVPLEKLRAQQPPELRKPLLASFPTVEANVSRRYAKGGFGGPVLHVVAVGATGTVPLTPPQMADLMEDPEVERQVLAADGFRSLGFEYRLPGATRERSRIELLRQGYGPFRYDLRVSIATERRDLEDGRIFLRYDPDSRPPPQGISLYRGACVLEPVDGGTRVSEILIIGTSLKVPGFVRQGLRNLVRTTLSNRVTNLWVRAWGAAAPR